MTDQLNLSDEGRARRERMLADLTGVMQQHHRSRRGRRRLASAACGLALVVTTGVVATLAARDLSKRPTAPGVSEALVGTAVQGQVAMIEMVRTDPTTLDRYRVTPGVRSIERIGDRMLVDELHRLGHPTGLVRVGERVYLTAANFDTRGATP